MIQSGIEVSVQANTALLKGTQKLTTINDGTGLFYYIYVIVLCLHCPLFATLQVIRTLA